MFFGEHFTPVQWLGVACLSGGILLLALRNIVDVVEAAGGAVSDITRPAPYKGENGLRKLVFFRPSVCLEHIPLYEKPRLDSSTLSRF